jgi:dephospho-CoA kinase
MFVTRGAHVIEADRVARELMRPGNPVYESVVQHFGREIVQADGAIDRQRLGAMVFGSGRIEELNRLVHPAVIARQDAWMRDIAAQDPRAIAIVEAALIFEAGVQGSFDAIVVVTCAPEQRIERFAQRAGIELESARQEVSRRMAAQLPEKEKLQAADYKIDNSGTLAQTATQVEDLMRRLRQLESKAFREG